MRMKAISVAVGAALAVGFASSGEAHEQVASEYAGGVPQDQSRNDEPVAQVERDRDTQRPVSLDAVQVTAQRRVQSMQEVPLSVSVMSTEQLRDKGIRTLGDLGAGNIPGMMAIRGQAVRNQVGFNIRGVTVSDPGQGTSEQGTGTYIDGVYLGRAQGLGLDLAEPEQIEVLRGPQGTLFGRNTEGGAVQIITAKPTGEFGGSATVSAAQYGQRRLFGSLNLPSAGNFSAKINVLRTSADGFFDNEPWRADLSAQEKFDANDDWGFRTAVRWTPTESLTVDYAYDRSASDYTGTYLHRMFSPLGDRPVDTERLDGAVMPTWNGWSSTAASGHSLTVDYIAPGGTQLKSITSYRELDDLSYVQTGGAVSFAPLPGPPASPYYARTGVVSYTGLTQDQTSQEFQLIGSLSDRLDYIVGLYHYNENVEDVRATGFTIYYTSPGPHDPVSRNFELAAPSVQAAETKASAVYANFTWRPHVLDDRLEFALGGRYSDDKKTFVRTVQGGVTLDNPIVPEPAHEERVDASFSGRLLLGNNSSAYYRYATGYRSGGVNVRSPTFRPYSAEEIESYEVGFKSDLLDNRLRLNGAIYRNEIKNFQAVVNPDPTNVSLTDTLNMSQPLIAEGIELEISLRPTDKLTVSGNYSYQRADLPVYQAAPSAAAQQLWAPIVPKHSGGLGLEYIFGYMGGGEISGRLDWQYMTEYYRPTIIASAQVAPATTNYLNGRLSSRYIQLPAIGSELSISIFGKNLLDKEFVLFSSNDSSAWSEPRQIGVEARIDF